jgi:hypothetical protein
MSKLVGHNPHTGAKLQSRLPNEAYRDNFDAIFRKQKEQVRKSAIVELTAQPAEADWTPSEEEAFQSMPAFDLFTLSDFKEGVHCGYICQYDGTGYFGTATEKSSVNCFTPVGDVAASGEYTHVYWYNK